ncbi:ssDNA endodeoxyribonuclease [Xylographa trunciseda]|nr:ssDNA endodeoxyribonuclease [Xylographa trunciseda]
MASTHDPIVPMFSAVSSSTRQLFQLLRCINFAPRAHVQITNAGLRFIVEESRIMQGQAFLDKSLFTSYTYNAAVIEPHEDDTEPGEDDGDPLVLEISLSSLLETLQIFASNDAKDRWSSRDPTYGGVTGSIARGGTIAAFDNRVLGMTGVCRLSCAGVGEPLCIVLEETGVTTTCELVTYEPEPRADIPLQTDAISQKIIMKASWLHDAITELSSTSPTRLTIVASPTAPYFALSSTGPLGSATVEFSKDPQLLETFYVPRRVVNTYKYSLIKGASRAMNMASKVSIRGDDQGVLSLQFIIEVGEDCFSFVDFRFVAYIPEEGEGDEEEEED